GDKNGGGLAATRSRPQPRGIRRIFSGRARLQASPTAPRSLFICLLFPCSCFQRQWSRGWTRGERRGGRARQEDAPCGAGFPSDPRKYRINCKDLCSVSSWPPSCRGKPLGFHVDDTKLKRAGLDYWPYVVVKIHDSWDEFRDYFMKQVQ
uniref:Uncharacterized protein n=1 Tax=Aegilops tauschii subsp. strangulata TaxID=200361 RepID=A0A453RJJ8_AEGTS